MKGSKYREMESPYASLCHHYKGRMWMKQDRSNMCAALGKYFGFWWVEFEVISYEHEENEVNIAPISLQGFKKQEYHNGIMYCMWVTQGFIPKGRTNANGPHEQLLEKVVLLDKPLPLSWCSVHRPICSHQRIPVEVLPDEGKSEMTQR